MPRVLVVEDDIDLNWTVCRVLNSHGYQTSGVGSSEEALLRFREQRPDLILLDVQLPGADGYRLARQIRASVDGGRIPIIFMTVNPELESKIIGFAAGADDYLVKPFDMRELLMRIQAVLRRTSGDPMRGDLSDAPERTLRVGELELDLDTATASTGWSSALLTPTELQLLRYFCRRGPHPLRTASPHRPVERRGRRLRQHGGAALAHQEPAPKARGGSRQPRAFADRGPPRLYAGRP